MNNQPVVVYRRYPPKCMVSLDAPTHAALVKWAAASGATMSGMCKAALSVFAAQAAAAGDPEAIAFSEALGAMGHRALWAHVLPAQEG